ncbi:glycosyltransferase [Luteimonas sp. FXH3W]|uniref:Glycosyltransferase n=1 Tax=Aquilutibacter rugosus TaxID=3115820 RepID=A0ABU7UXK1_9GAMM
MSGSVVVIPACSDENALDACLAALDAGTLPGTRVWIPDNAAVTPRGFEIIKAWIARTKLKADYTRRQSRTDELVNMAEIFRAVGDADVCVLSPFAVPTRGWLTRLEACLAADPSVATATPWSNLGDILSWPLMGELNALPDDPQAIAQAAANMPRLFPEIPAAVPHCVLVRGKARAAVGSLDADSFSSWYAGLVDWSMRFAGLGWRNVLCESSFVGCTLESHAHEGDAAALFARWPAWQDRQAHFVLNDPLRSNRHALTQRLQELTPPDLQRDLFDAIGDERAA